MSEERSPVNTVHDAFIFLGYMSRYSTGEFAQNCAGCVRVLLQLEADLAAAQARCVDLARTLENAEAAGKKRGAK